MIFLSIQEQNVQNIKVFADYNGGDFDDNGETIFTSEKQKVHQGKIVVPQTARQGTPLQVRVIASYSGFKISSAYFGQVEDYSMIVGTPLLAAQQDLSDLAEQENNTSQFTMATPHDYTLYPNPATDRQVYLPAAGPSKIEQLELLDVNGRLLKTIKSSMINQNQIKIKIGDIAKGIYYLRITDDTAVSVKKLNRM
jgi:hypothetical protein